VSWLDAGETLLRRAVHVLAAAFWLFVLVSLAHAATVKPGVERWYVKTHATITAPRTVSLAALEALGDVPGVTHNDKRYDKALIPQGIAGLHEGVTVVTTGTLRLVATEPDGDYHVQLAEDARTMRVLIVECPRPQYAAANLRAKCKAARATLDRMSIGNSVRVTGQLFYDDAHVGDPPRGKRGMKATTLWELHPVVRVETL
jgi:hypothetical protein